MRTDTIGYDEYDSLVVAANTPGAARDMIMSQHIYHYFQLYEGFTAKNYTLKCVGTYNRELKEPKVIISSFNAG
jgi:hypothetical protein